MRLPRGWSRHHRETDMWISKVDHSGYVRTYEVASEGIRMPYRVQERDAWKG